MKIGILTQPLAHNYGGTLQNYALQMVLRELGHEPVTLNHGVLSNGELRKVYQSYFYRCLICSRVRHSIAVPKNVNYFEKHFREFEKKYINSVFIGNQIVNKKKFNELKLDAIVVGSDQVWRSRYNPRKLLMNMFLDFAEHRDDIIKIAYAASFGVDTWDFTPEQTRIASRLIKRFDAVSVREDSGVTLCSEYLGIEAVDVLDPTMLAPRSIYDSLIDDNSLYDSHIEKDKYAAVYILDLTEKKKKFVENFCKKNGLKPIYIGTRNEDGIWPSIESWLLGIRESDVVLTDSFHGTVFSIIFKRPFLNIGNKNRGQRRIESLCELIGLKQLSLNENELNNYTIPRMPWEQVTLNLENSHTISFQFLNRALKNEG